jgi:hypothetical protein
MTATIVLDSAGRRRSPATMPGYHAGRPPRNKGRRYPADPPTGRPWSAAGARVEFRKLAALRASLLDDTHAASIPAGAF